MSKELELIAESMQAVATDGARDDGQLWGAFPNTMNVRDLAAHVVSRLSEHGYSIVATVADRGHTSRVRQRGTDPQLWMRRVVQPLRGLRHGGLVRLTLPRTSNALRRRCCR